MESPALARRLVPVICCALASALAQAPPEVDIRSGAWFPPGLVISTDTNLVELVAVVRDRQGLPAGGLLASDFELLDNNHAREISFFSEQRAPSPGRAPAKPLPVPALAEPPQPRSIALFFDDAHATPLGMKKSAEAAAHLVSSDLHPGDRVGIFTASGAVSVDFTGDRERLLAALAHIQPHALSGPKALSQCPTLTPSAAYVIVRNLDPDALKGAMNDAAGCYCDKPPSAQCIAQQRTRVDSTAQTVWGMSEYRSTTTLDALGIVIRHLAGAPETRMLVLMSPGFPTGGMENRTSALVDAALRSRIRISAVNSEGLEPRGSALHSMVRNEFMAAASHATGGQFLHDTNDWTGSLETAAALPGISYLIGFAPPGDPDGKYHLLKIRLQRKPGYRVESRAGYFAAAAAREHEPVQARIDRIAMSAADIDDFPVSLSLRQDLANLHLTIAIDARRLQFPRKEQLLVQELTFLTVLEDADGNFTAGKQSVMQLRLTPPTLAAMQQKGIQAAVSFSVPLPDACRVRVVVREAAQDRIWAGRQSCPFPGR